MTFLVTVVIELQRNILKVSSEYLAVKCVSWCGEVREMVRAAVVI